MDRAFRTFTIFAAVLGSAAVILAWLHEDMWRWVASDYVTFYAASRIPVPYLFDGPNFTFVYPPTAIFLTRLLSLASYWPGYFILTGLSVILFVIAVRPRRVAALSLLSMPALQGLLWGQIAILLAAGMFWALTLPPWRKGLALGFLLSIKPQLFLAAPVIFLVQRDFRAAIGTATGAALSVATSIALFGIDSWIHWLSTLPRFQDFLVRSNALVGVISPTGIALRFGLPIIPFAVIGIALAAWIISRSKTENGPAELAAMIGGASLMASPYGMTHDAIVLMPAAVLSLLAGRNAAPSILVYAAPFIPGSALLFLATWLGKRPPSANQANNVA